MVAAGVGSSTAPVLKKFALRADLRLVNVELARTE
jgi:hypothetical protein